MLQRLGERARPPDSGSTGEQGGAIAIALPELPAGSVDACTLAGNISMSLGAGAKYNPCLETVSWLMPISTRSFMSEHGSYIVIRHPLDKWQRNRSKMGENEHEPTPY